jgi:peptidoglycan hydrolase-like protein with peptidoglycan-binding domain
MKQKIKYIQILVAVLILSGILGFKMYAHADTPSPWIITQNLSVGSQNEEVSKLQEFLKNQGFFTYPQITGYFGPITKAAVIEFQKANGITPVGIVGPITRAKIIEILSQNTETPTPLAPIKPENSNHRRTSSYHRQDARTLGGTVSGLSTPDLVLQNNNGDDLAISADGPFTFARTIRKGTDYNITVSQQPTGKICVVANGTDTMGGSDVTNVSVSCSVALESITVTPSNSHLPVGINEQFTATGHYSDSSTADITTSVVWDLSDQTVATINNAGLLTGLSAGLTQVSATMDGVSGTTTLTVTDAVLVAITISPSNPSVARNSSIQLSAIGTFSDSSEVDITNQAAWASTHTNIATINNTDHKGNVTGVAGGSTTIQASLNSITGTATLFVGI